MRRQCTDAEAALQAEVDRHRLDAFPLVVAAPNLRVGTTTLLQSWGVGPIRANTVLLNWLDGRASATAPTLSLWYARLLARAARVGQHVVVLDAKDPEWVALERLEPHERTIDVWWFEDDSSRLALLFAYLMTRTEEWDEATLRVLVPAATDAAQKVEASLRRRLEELQIAVVHETEPEAHRRSTAAATVFMPLRLEGIRLLHTAGQPMEALLDSLPIVAMVAACGDVQLRDDDLAEPDTAAERSAAAARHMASSRPALDAQPGARRCQPT